MMGRNNFNFDKSFYGLMKKEKKLDPQDDLLLKSQPIKKEI